MHTEGPGAVSRTESGNTQAERRDDRSPGPRLSAAVACLILIIAGAGFCYPVLFEGRTFYAFDALQQYLPWSAAAPTGFRPHNPLITDPVNVMYPYFLFFKESLGMHTLRYWNDAVLGGLPVLPVLHPTLVIAYLLFSVSVAHDLVLGTHLLLSGLCMFLFLRRIALGNPAALLGALAWMFNPYLMVWFEFENLILMAPSLPATLYFIECRLHSSRPVYTAGLATALAYGLAVNSAQPMLYQLLFVGVYTGYRWFQMKKRGSGVKLDLSRRRVSAVLALVLVLNVGIAVALAHRSIAAGSQRRAVAFSELTRRTGGLPAKYLITLMFPDFYGNPTGPLTFTPRLPGAQPYNNYNELCIYTGIAPLFLAATCLPAWRRRPHIMFFLTGAAVCIPMAMGSVLYYPLARGLPGLTLSTPTRILYLFGFCMAASSALGADILLEKRTRRPYVLWGIWGLLFLVMLSAAAAVQSESVVKWMAGITRDADWRHAQALLSAHFSVTSTTLFEPLLLGLAAWAAVSLLAMNRGGGARSVLFWALVLILCLDLMRFGRNYNTTAPRRLAYPSTPAIEFLQKDRSLFRIAATDHFLSNGFAPFGIQDAGGYASFFSRRYARYFALSQEAPPPDAVSRWTSFNRFGSPLLNLLNVKYFLVPPNWTSAAPGVKRVYDGEINIYENLETFPRFFFVYGYELAPNPDAAFRKAAAFSAADFKSKVILESPPPSSFRPEPSPMPPDPSRIEIRTYRTDRIDVRVESDQNGFLVIGDTYHPDWRARLDGQATPVLRANTVMRAVAVPAGHHRVVLEFKPLAARAAVVLAYAAWGILLVWMVVEIIRERRSTSGIDGPIP